MFGVWCRRRAWVCAAGFWARAAAVCCTWPCDVMCKVRCDLGGGAGWWFGCREQRAREARGCCGATAQRQPVCMYGGCLVLPATRPCCCRLLYACVACVCTALLLCAHGHAYRRSLANTCARGRESQFNMCLCCVVVVVGVKLRDKCCGCVERAVVSAFLSPCEMATRVHSVRLERKFPFLRPCQPEPV